METIVLKTRTDNAGYTHGVDSHFGLLYVVTLPTYGNIGWRQEPRRWRLISEKGTELGYVRRPAPTGRWEYHIQIELEPLNAVLVLTGHAISRRQALTLLEAKIQAWAEQQNDRIQLAKAA